jgi:uncharacterized membrane protein
MTQQANVNTGTGTPEKPKGLALTGMILGIGSIVIALIPCVNVVSPLPAIVAIILSAIALSKIKAGTAGGKGMAVAGLVCGIVALVVFAVATVLFGAASYVFRSKVREANKAMDNALLLLRCLPYC